MHQIDCSLHCTKTWDPAVREALDHVFFIHRGRVQPCIDACSKTEAINPRAITSASFVPR